MTVRIPLKPFLKPLKRTLVLKCFIKVFNYDKVFLISYIYRVARFTRVKSKKIKIKSLPIRAIPEHVPKPIALITVG
jgi:hypothetical protein